MMTASDPAISTLPAQLAGRGVEPLYHTILVADELAGALAYLDLLSADYLALDLGGTAALDVWSTERLRPGGEVHAARAPRERSIAFFAAVFPVHLRSAGPNATVRLSEGWAKLVCDQ